jgi:hypothetical protein
MEAIPWRLGEDPNISLWLWEAEHFKAKIQTDSYRQSFSWEVFDLSQGYDSSLADGFQHSFRSAEEAVREVIGKSYPASLGYMKYAGHFATTFKIFTGERIDFGPMEATSVVLTVRVADKKTGDIKERQISGMIHVIHYTIEISPEHGQTMRIPPSRIVAIKKEFGGYAKPKEDDSLAKGLRIYKGKVTMGCTGKPGMLPDTVEHNTRAAHCPIHEN